MTDVVRVSGDYKIITQANGNIVLDTTGGNLSNSSDLGTVTIYGNLDIQGIQTIVSATSVSITGTNIILNEGQQVNGTTGAGQITAGDGTDYGKSGLIIDRGNSASLLLRASMLFDNTVISSSSIGERENDLAGGWFFRVNNAPSMIYAAGIRLDTTNLPTSSIVEGRPRFSLLGYDSQNAVLSVDGTNGYADYLIASGQPNDIPNLSYVQQYVDSAPAGNAQSAETLANGPSGNYWGQITIGDATIDGSGIMSFLIDGEPVMTLGGIGQEGSVQMNGISIVGTTIQPVFTGTNILLTTVDADVTVQAAVAYNTPLYTPTATTNQVKVYSTSTTGAGGTGLLFVNTQGTDELVSAKKALIYSIIF